MMPRTRPWTHRSFGWGVIPHFARCLSVSTSKCVSRPAGGASEPRSARHARRERSSLAAGAAGSVLFHGLLGILALSGSVSLGVAAPRLTRTPSTDRIQVVTLLPPRFDQNRPRAATPVSAEKAAPDLDLTEVAVRRAASTPIRPAVAAEGAGQIEVPSFEVSPSGDGDPEAATHGVANGEERGYTAPRARSILDAWGRVPAALLGREVLARVHVDSTGWTTGLFELDPPTGDDRTDRALRYRALNLRYWPALSDGRPVAGWAEISFRFCYDGVTAVSPPDPTFGRGDACGRIEEPAPRDSTDAPVGTE